MIFLHVINIRQIKRIAKFEGLEPRRCEDIKGIVAPERDPKSFGTFEKQAPGPLYRGTMESKIRGFCSLLKFHLRDILGPFIREEIRRVLCKTRLTYDTNCSYKWYKTSVRVLF